MSFIPRPLAGVMAIFLLSFSGACLSGAPASPIVINEIMQNPSAVNDSEGEWFELYNPGTLAVDINGWTIRDAGADSHVITNGGPLEIPADGYLVLGNNSNSGTNGGVTVDYSYGSGFFLANGADELILEDGSMTEIDSVAWDGGATFPDPNGASMSLEDPALDNSAGINWCESTTPFGAGDLGTPGAANVCAAAPPQIVINEIMQNPSAVLDSAGEWFELYNAGDSTVDLEGWTIQDNDFDSHVIASGDALPIPAGSYLVLGNNDDSGTNGGVTVAYEYTGIALANGSDELVLLDDSMTEIDRVEWDDGASFPDPNGATMSLISPALDNNVGANWCEATTSFGSGDSGTPGGANDCLPAIVINEIMQNPDAVGDSDGEWFELYNAGDSAVDIDGWTIRDNGSDSHGIKNGGPLLIPAGGFIVLGPNADGASNGGVTVDYAYGGGFFLANGDDELILLDSSMLEIDRVEWDGGPNFPDPTGASMALENPALDNNVGANWCEASTAYGDGDFGTPGAINDCLLPPVINEIMQNPNAVFDSAGEWFEIYNPGASPVDIDGWTIEDNGSDSHTIDNGGPLEIPAGGYIVLGNNGDSGTNGGVTVDYVYSDFFLANGDDEVVLLDGSMTEMDRVEYDGGPNFPDPTGASMALSDAGLDNNVGANWCESSTTFGAGDSGTPGAENDCGPQPLVCGDPVTLISAIQGTGDVSPMVGMEVEIEGIVVADLQGPGEFGGLFIQEEDGDADGNAATSEGLFAFTNLPADLHDHVRIRGTVIEFNGLTELSPTSAVEICATGATPPTPAMPMLPMDAGDSFEAYESMSVEMPGPLVIIDNFNAFRFGELIVSSSRLVQPTQAVSPGTPANNLAAANALDQLIIDDRRTGENLTPPINGQDDTNPLAADNTIRTGQTVSGLTGVMHYGFGAYRVQPTGPFVINEAANPRTATPDAVGGSLKVASFNVLNYFTTIGNAGPICGPAMNQDCRGADSPEEYTRQLDKLVAAITAIDADVLGVQELENNASASLQGLVDAVNDVMGPGTYDFIDTGTIGTDAIKVGLIYKPASVTPEGDFALLTNAVDARFDDSLNRPSLAQSFRSNANLALFTPVVNHLKSKSCGGASGDDDDQGDGQSCYNAARTSAAEALRDWANADPTGTGAENVLILGDLNSYRMEDPIRTLTDGGLTDLEPAFQGPEAYSYVFFGQIGSLDHAMSTSALTPQVTGVDSWNINADEPRVLDYNTEFGVLPSFYDSTPYRSSDHDPIIVGLDMDPPMTITIPTLDPSVDAELEITGGGDSCGISAAAFIDPNTLVPPPPPNLGFPYGVLQFTADRCTPGATITMNVTFPVPNAFLAWFKHTVLGGWAPYPFQLNGNTFSFQVTDGGTGDEDLTVNGTIVDPSGPAVVETARATFAVTKDFNDDNTAEVEVAINCTTGDPIMQTGMLAEGGSLKFIVGDFDVGELDCTVAETPVEGYTPDHLAGTGLAAVAGDVQSGTTECAFVEVSNGEFICDITNSLQEVEVVIDKIWIDDQAGENSEFLFAGAKWHCNPVADLDDVRFEPYWGHLTFHGSLHGYREVADPARLWDYDSFDFYPHYEGSTCSVTELELDSNVFTDDSDCDDFEISPGYDLDGAPECVIINTRIYAGIPTLSEYGLALLALLMLGVGFVAYRRCV